MNLYSIKIHFFSQKIGLIGEKTKCINCEKSKSYINEKDRNGVCCIFRCNNKTCRKKHCLLTRTIFQNTRIKISQCLLLIYCYSLKLSINSTIEQVNISRQTIKSCNQRLRTIFVEKYDTLKKSKIGGELCFVEFD